MTRPFQKPPNKRYGPKTKLGGCYGMADDQERIHVTKTEARAGSTPGVTRYILAVSLVAVIVVFGYILLT